MIRSMTGYGRAQQVISGRDISVEIKAVNHRYLEYSSRFPRAYGYLDDAVKKAVAEAVSRGKVEVGLFIQNISAKDTEVSVNMDVAAGYYAALSHLAEDLAIPNDVKASTLSRFNDVFSVVKTAESEEEIKTAVFEVFGQALAAFVAMREAEGEKLKEDILGRLNTLQEMIEIVEKQSQGCVTAYQEKLYKKLQTILEDKNIDDVRVLQEAAIFADKTAVDEETVRLKSHIKQYKEILNSGSPAGKKLDFLTQEMNREVNTIGSKANDLVLTRTVVDMKSEIEKIREQIQNIE